MARIKAILTGGPRPIWLRYLLLITVASFLVRGVLLSDWLKTTSVLYIAVPFVVGVLIYIFVPQPAGLSYGTRLWRHMRSALIIMLSTSFLLFEGFLCVLMFLPIYFLFAMIGIAVFPPTRREKTDAGGTPEQLGNIFRMSAIPLLIFFLSLDGIRGMEPSRHTEVSRTALLPLTPAQIQANIIDHDYPDEGRSAFLKAFPRPVFVEAKALHVGARHTGHWEYRRWGVPGLNVHKGTSVLEFTDVSKTRLRAQIIHDDSYISHYMRFKTWQLDLTPRPDGTTEATLTVTYDRKLAPAWYFGPMQRKVVGDGLDYALGEIMGRS